MVESNNGLDIIHCQLRDEVIVVIESGLVDFPCSIWQDSCPGDGKPIHRKPIHVFDQPNVFFILVVGIASDFAITVVSNVSSFRVRSEGVPNAETFAILIPATLDLMLINDLMKHN